MNLSQKKRQRMLEFLAQLREEHKDDDSTLTAIGEIENELNSKKYGLVWESHEEAVDVKMQTQIPVFTEDTEKELTAVTDSDYNFLLEGDNLHSLYLLEKTHKGRIDVIYIDPPYNTGKKNDFRYNDAFVVREDSFRHSKWLSFMTERLRIAGSLLSSNGAIFISIDDDEQSALKLLCDDIFGADNFVASAIWEKKFSPQNDSRWLFDSHDFVLVYAKKKRNEEHANDTKKAQDMIEAFSAKHIIRVSATANPNKKCEFFEIDEVDVIGTGLITKALYVNEGVTENAGVSSDVDYILELADMKRKEIFAHYKKLAKSIVRPLVLIQFPNGQPETIEAVEKKLEEMGYTYDNGMVAKWMANDKKNLIEDFTHNDGVPVFLLMKQAVSTGWDCPRAKILVKLREGMSENFEVQTIGRIRRMPEAKHYEGDLLDFCYVYTFDEKYKEGLLSDIDWAYETRRLFLKDKCKTFTLEKQMRDLDFDGLGDRDILAMLHQHLVVKYKLGEDKEQNKMLLESKGYVFGDELIGQVLHGRFVEIADLTNRQNLSVNNYLTTRQKVDTHRHGIYLLHSVDSIKTAIGIPTAKVKVILERLFRKSTKRRFKLIDMPTLEFYAFVINNAKLLRNEFREITSNVELQKELIRDPKTSEFHIPEQDFFKYDPGVKDEVDYLNNAYKDYTSGFATSLVRSTSEMLFEQYCETSDDIEWVYKNGDSGQQYFSIVYVDGIQHQWLFYADYIVMKKDGTVWVIETKGGESHGKDKNIDRQIEKIQCL